jgi:hypothetical protein
MACATRPRTGSETVTSRTMTSLARVDLVHMVTACAMMGGTEIPKIVQMLDELPEDGPKAAAYCWAMTVG